MSDHADRPSKAPRRHHVPSSPYLELEHPFTVWEAIKLIVLAPLAILRVTCALCILVAFAAVCSLATIGAKPDEPFAPWRRRLVYSARLLGKLVVMALGFWVRVDGWHHYLHAQRHGTRLMVFNHPSWVDSILLQYLFAPSGVSREANLRYPIVGRIIFAFQNIYVPFRTASEQMDSTQQPLAQRTTTQLIADRLSDPRWPMIAIAPEGMTTNGKQILRFRTGAFVHGEPVLPVCIQYRWRHLNPAWTVCSEPWHVIRMLTQIVNVAHVQILPAYEPTRAEIQEPGRFAEHVRHRMSEAMHVPLVREGIAEYHAVARAGITVDWRGKLIVPPNTLDAYDCIPLTPSNQSSPVAQRAATHLPGIETPRSA